MKKLIKQLTKFLITGGISAGITLVVMNLALFFHVPLFLSSMVGYAAGILNSFILNKKWTFQVEDEKSRKQAAFLLFIFVVFNLAVMVLFGTLNLGFFALTEHKFLSQILSIFVTTVLNFTVYKTLIFRK